MAMMLRAAGHDVATFPGASDYLAAGRMMDTACLILDVSMPEMTGPELQARLIEDGYRIPIVVITGDDSDVLRRRLLSRGALGLLRKPVDGAALLSTIATALADR